MSTLFLARLPSRFGSRAFQTQRNDNLHTDDANSDILRRGANRVLALVRPFGRPEQVQARPFAHLASIHRLEEGADGVAAGYVEH